MQNEWLIAVKNCKCYNCENYNREKGWEIICQKRSDDTVAYVSAKSEKCFMPYDDLVSIMTEGTVCKDYKRHRV